MLKVQDMKDKLVYIADEIVPAFSRAGEAKLSQRISDCGDFIRVAECCDCHGRHFAGASRCKSRFCPVCAKLRSLLWLAKLVSFFNAWLSSGGYVFKLNFTVRDTASLKDGLNLIGDAWRIMTNSDRLMRREFRTRFSGGIRSLEVKLGKNSGLWHPHLHCLVLKDRFGKDYGVIRDMWERAARLAARSDNDSDKVGSVWLKGFDASRENDLLDAIVETFKYITDLKFFRASNEQIKELVESLRGKRGIQAWGNMYNMPDDVEDAFNAKDYDEIQSYVCGVCGFDKFTFDVMTREAFIKDAAIKNLLNKNDDMRKLELNLEDIF